MHFWPDGQSTSAQSGSTQKPSSHTLSGGHTNSPESHAGTHVRLSHTSAGGQRSPSSTVPSQSLSSASHFSSFGSWSGTHVSSPFWHCIVPSAQMPSWPVSHFPPPPEHEMPVTNVVRSSKSLSPPESRSSQPK